MSKSRSCFLTRDRPHTRAFPGIEGIFCAKADHRLSVCYWSIIIPAQLWRGWILRVHLNGRGWIALYGGLQPRGVVAMVCAFPGLKSQTGGTRPFSNRNPEDLFQTDDDTPQLHSRASTFCHSRDRVDGVTLLANIMRNINNNLE